MEIKEVFYAARALRVNISIPEGMDSDFYLDDNKSKIANKLYDELGLDISDAVDMYPSEGNLSLFFIKDFDFKLGVRPFRGFTLREGETLILCDEMMKVVDENVSEYPIDDLKTSYTVYKIEYDDKNNEIHYFMQCLVDGEIKDIQLEEE